MRPCRACHFSCAILHHFAFFSHANSKYMIGGISTWWGLVACCHIPMTWSQRQSSSLTYHLELRSRGIIPYDRSKGVVAKRQFRGGKSSPFILLAPTVSDSSFANHRYHQHHQQCIGQDTQLPCGAWPLVASFGPSLTTSMLFSKNARACRTTKHRRERKRCSIGAASHCMSANQLQP